MGMVMTKTTEDVACRSGWQRLLGGALLATALGCGSAAMARDPGVGADEIVIGQSITLQGGKNAYGVAAREGMQLYLDMVNDGGGVHGRKVVVRTLDDDNKAATAEANARRLVEEGAFVLFGSIEGGPSTSVMKVAAETKVPFFGPMAGAPGLRSPHQPLVFPVRAEHKDEFRALMQWGRSTGLRTVGFLHADSAVGQEHLANVVRIAAELGLQVALPIASGADVSDAKVGEIAARIAQVQPDMMFNHGSPALYARVVAAAKRAYARTTFMAVNSGSSQIARDLGPLATGMVFAQVVPSPVEGKREIAREFQDAVRRLKPGLEPSYGAMEGFMTAKALVMGLRAAGKEPTRASFVKALEGGRMDLGGVVITYAPGDHAGSRFVDLSMVAASGRFIH